MGIRNKHRIPWSKVPTAASSDRMTLNKYMRKEISKSMAIEMLEKNNKCQISEEQFDANVKWLGYERRKDS